MRKLPPMQDTKYWTNVSTPLLEFMHGRAMLWPEIRAWARAKGRKYSPTYTSEIVAYLELTGQIRNVGIEPEVIWTVVDLDAEAEGVANVS